jgi:hypothetical protein
MALFIKILLLLLVVALAAPFILNGPDGQPLMTLEDIQKPGALSNLAESISEVNWPFQGDEKSQPATPKSGKRKIYSWRDEQGKVHYSNIAPTNSASVKTIQVDPNTNVVKMAKPAEGQAASMPVEEEHSQTDSKPSMISVYTPEGTQKLTDDARAIEDKLQERQQEFDRVIDQR